MRALPLFAIAIAASAWASSASAEEPWSDNDPNKPMERLEVGDFGFIGAAEYRAQGTYINPISLNTIEQRRIAWLDHRLRLEGGVDYDQKVKLFTSIDVLAGVLWATTAHRSSRPSPMPARP